MMDRVLKLTADSAPVAERSDVQFETLYRREFAFVWRSVRALGVAQSAAEDVVQEVFVVVHRRLADYDPNQGSLRGWVYGIARLAALRHHRTTRRKDPNRLSPPVAQAAEQPDDVLARNQAAVLVQAFVDKLDGRRREVFVLHDIEGVPAPQIATMLGLKLGTVYSRLRRAREKFQKYVHRQQARDARGLRRHG